MSLRTAMTKTLSNALRGIPLAALGAVLLMSAVPGNAQVSQSPLSVGSGVPGNLVLTPSVEWPTLDSMANIELTYSADRAFPGYFDPDKCYKYQYATAESGRYFYPSGTTTTRTCNAADKQWSGNFLNWAATQTIDPFRKALTGGYRVKDEAGVTWLEKARSDSNTSSSIYPDRNLLTTTDVSGGFPSTVWDFVGTRVRTFGNRMRFRGPGVYPGTPPVTFPSDAGTWTRASLNNTPVAYNPDDAAHLLDLTDMNTVYEVSIRVAVCYTAGLLEDNCVRYGANYKPEGLIQQYSRRVRFSAFGFLNDHTDLKDGGVLRARQKFVGPLKLDKDSHLWVDNTNKEWSATTGVIFGNPDSADATATATAVGTVPAASSTAYNTGTNAVPVGSTSTVSKTVNNSGVINYINRFGQMTSKTHKSRDPVSELYYTALRYLRRQPNITAYSDFAGTANEKYELVDGFPVISNWDGIANDPIEYRCQSTAILGIGDTNTHKDKNLPGHDAHSSYNDNDTNTEPVDSAVAPMTVTSIDVWAATQKVAGLEGITIATNGAFTGRQNSAYIAGLAYIAHTQDMRLDLEGLQTFSTHWVDVRENQVLQPKARNQYWLAAKYGGFTLPELGDNDPPFDPYAATITIPESAWHTNGETLESGDLRPDNFYVASDADKMISSLTQAFERIVAADTGSSASLAANSTRLDAETRTYQAQFITGQWTGELSSFVVAADGSLTYPPAWSATETTSLARANWASRNIMVNTGTSQIAFAWDNLTAGQKTALVSTELVDWIRGDDSGEQLQGGAFRNRTVILGDIVNSTPVFVGKPNARLYANATFSGAGTYNSFATDNVGRIGVVYVGGNDGMLHAFNAGGDNVTVADEADDGQEMYAFIPNSVITNGLAAVADPAYAHRYYVDGDMAIADVYDTAASSWKTVLVGTLGRGGPGIFALDITDPENILFLWEKSGTDIPALGKNIGKPVIAQVADGDWRVLLGNGPESTANTANLITINVLTGVATTINANATANNALSAVLARDTDGNGFADTAYAGDTFGNLWKITGINGAGAKSTLFVATDPAVAQPITAAPLVGRDPVSGKLWVFFGTGSYLSDDDFTDTQQQTWYGVQDLNDGVTVLRSELLQRSIDTTIAYNTGANASSSADDTLGKRIISEGTAADLDLYKGWFINLPTSRERMVVPNRFQGSALIGTTRIPDPSDACDPSGGGWVMAINPFTGARLERTFFDINGDGLFNNLDMEAGEIISGIGLNSGPNNPIFVEDVMQISLDDGTTKTIRTQNSSVQAQRMNWREVTN
jgi:type IV pilus assembly protein PilY1